MWKNIEREKDKLFLEDYQEEMMPFANPKLRKMLRVCKDPNNQPPCKYMQVREKLLFVSKAPDKKSQPYCTQEGQNCIPF